MKKFLFFTFLLICIGAGIYFYQGEVLPVKQIQIEGDLQHADIELVQQTILPFMQYGLLRVDIGEMQNALLSVPWIAKARVSRTWPDSIHIWLAEPRAVARWADSGIVSEEGRVFYLPRDLVLPENVPVFEGLEGQVSVMLDQFQQMQAVLAPIQLNITRVVLTPRFAWELELNNGMVLRLGQQQILQRLERFTKVYPQLANKPMVDIEYVDLRYPNGFALKTRYKN